VSDRVHDSGKNSPFKRGLVEKVDPAKARAKVKFADEDGNISFWLNINGSGSGKNKSYNMPDIGSQVNCLIDWDGEDGTVLGSPFSEADKPPTSNGDTVHLKSESGTDIIFNKKTGDIDIKGANIVKIQAVKIILEGDVHLGGEGGQLVHRKGDADNMGDIAEGSATKVYAV